MDWYGEASVKKQKLGIVIALLGVVGFLCWRLVAAPHAAVTRLIPEPPGSTVHIPVSYGAVYAAIDRAHHEHPEFLRYAAVDFLPPTHEALMSRIAETAEWHRTPVIVEDEIQTYAPPTRRRITAAYDCFDRISRKLMRCSATVESLDNAPPDVIDGGTALVIVHLAVSPLPAPPTAETVAAAVEKLHRAGEVR